MADILIRVISFLVPSLRALRKSISLVTLVRHFLIAANWFYLTFEKHEFFVKVISYQKQLKHHVWVFSVLPKKVVLQLANVRRPVAWGFTFLVLFVRVHQSGGNWPTHANIVSSALSHVARFATIKVANVTFVRTTKCATSKHVHSDIGRQLNSLQTDRL